MTEILKARLKAANSNALTKKLSKDEEVKSEAQGCKLKCPY